jgi:hypothetical protein
MSTQLLQLCQEACIVLLKEITNQPNIISDYFYNRLSCILQLDIMCFLELSSKNNVTISEK